MSADKGESSEKFELNSGDEGGKINYGSTAGEDEETEVGRLSLLTYDFRILLAPLFSSPIQV